MIDRVAAVTNGGRRCGLKGFSCKASATRSAYAENHVHSEAIKRENFYGHSSDCQFHCKTSPAIDVERVCLRHMVVQQRHVSFVCCYVELFRLFSLFFMRFSNFFKDKTFENQKIMRKPEEYASLNESHEASFLHYTKS
jgi:hypothetical protein